jgi:release factor glutamine methyltransferase
VWCSPNLDCTGVPVQRIDPFTGLNGGDWYNALPWRTTPAPRQPQGQAGSVLVQPEPLEVDLTAGELLAWRRQQLLEGARPEELDWLLELVAGVDWATLQRLRLDPSRRLRMRASLGQLAALWTSHLETAQPLQYLAGVCPWRDLHLTVAPGVLIPRPETELLVELAQAHWLEASPPLWADLGTGSGCLAVALARLWPEGEGLAVDCSPQALQQAERNLRGQGVQERVRLLAGSWWEPLRPWWGRLNLVVANPPYIPTAVWDQLEPVVREHEPRIALDGGPDGLEAIRAITAGASKALAPGGWLLLEHHHDQSDAVLDQLREEGLGHVTDHCDLEGIRRFAVARRGPAASATLS